MAGKKQLKKDSKGSAAKPNQSTVSEYGHNKIKTEPLRIILQVRPFETKLTLNKIVFRHPLKITPEAHSPSNKVVTNYVILLVKKSKRMFSVVMRSTRPKWPTF